VRVRAKNHAGHPNHHHRWQVYFESGRPDQEVNLKPPVKLGRQADLVLPPSEGGSERGVGLRFARTTTPSYPPPSKGGGITCSCAIQVLCFYKYYPSGRKRVSSKTAEEIGNQMVTYCTHFLFCAPGA